MPRNPRISPVGIPQHVITRGNNRQVCFTCEDDMDFYLSCLKEYSAKSDVDIHSWVLMTNHIHLLCTPNKEVAVSKMMQDVGRLYVRYFNKTYKRSGTLWEGRFKSSLVQSEHYLLSVYRYIELNPVRAGMVHDPADYEYSSYRSNALGKSDGLCTPHQEYLLLADDGSARQDNYRALFALELDMALIDNIRKTTNQGMAIGSERFIDEISRLTGFDMHTKDRGRPKGWRKKE